ncbi:sugar O-acetyltransferase [Listeria grandensis]|uniref:sugar O-acetyltransferase n=1 Tax=Listeria grandensis TaxID=1494963 RepID=UPI00164D9802|nr:sugar O-acetyltransferase [Listeria grandensis]MBC6315780.1 sugar O-acetyltransferase [Listeria grandensis]
MKEKEKMLSGNFYEHRDKELTNERNLAAEATYYYNTTKESEAAARRSILEALLGKVGDNVTVKTPFKLDYGYNIELGDNTFLNYGVTILDCNKVTIGKNVLIAPNVQIYTAKHPLDPDMRLMDKESALPIVIEDNVWIGGGAIILAGVTIGKNSVIGAGSVVTKSIPPNAIAVGNPCRVVKELVVDGI